jgi:hypothetical protein
MMRAKNDALPSFSMVASWRRSRVAQQVAPSDKYLRLPAHGEAGGLVVA